LTNGNSQKGSTSKLPQTNEDTANPATVMGAVLLGLSSLAALLGRGFKREDHEK